MLVRITMPSVMWLGGTMFFFFFEKIKSMTPTKAEIYDGRPPHIHHVKCEMIAPAGAVALLLLQLNPQKCRVVERRNFAISFLLSAATPARVGVC